VASRVSAGAVAPFLWVAGAASFFSFFCDR
jgi:hypothetical protein